MQLAANKWRVAGKTGSLSLETWYLVTCYCNLIIGFGDLPTISRTSC